MSLIMDPIPPFSHLTSSQQQLQPPHHSDRSPLSANRPQHSAVFPAHTRPVHRRGSSQTRSTSHSRAERLENLLPEQIKDQLPLSPNHSVNTTWSSPRDSPRPHTFLQPSRPNNTHPSPSRWVVPTPSHSEASLPSIQNRALPSHPVNPTNQQPQSAVAPPVSGSMASVHYAMPSQYGPLGIDESSLHEQGYTFEQSFRPSVPQHPPQQSYDFSQAETYGTAVMRTSSPMPMPQQYNDEYRAGSSYSYSSGMTPRVLPSTSMGSNASSYSSAYEGSPNMYDRGMYSHHAMPGPQSLAGGVPSSLAYAQPMYGAPSLQSMPRSMSSISSTSSVRMASQKPKPQCWEHGCNGRRFSTFSNLLRHQREKSGTATKSYCPRCGAEFTRTTARNGHLAHDKCTKQRKSSEGSQ